MAYSDGTPFYRKCPIPATTSAVTVTKPIQSKGYQSITVAADGLAAAEEADLFIKVGTGWEVLADSAGTARKLTATITQLTLEGGPTYGVTKDATAGACGIFVIRQVLAGE